MLKSKEPISVLVVTITDKLFDAFKDLISKSYETNIKRAFSVGEAKRLILIENFDIVVINAPLKDESGIEFAIDLSYNSATGILLLINNEYYEQVLDEVIDHGILTISKPLTRHTLYESINLVAATNFRLKKVEKKNAKLTAKMEEIRVVNHAKWVLINNLGIPEESAHKLIEKQAMDTRLSKREVAENIIKTYNVGK